MVQNGQTNRPEIHEATSKCCWCFDSSLTRFVTILLICIIGFLNAAVINISSGLQTLIKASYTINDYQYEFLTMMYIIPNVIWCVTSGLLLDLILGLRCGSIIFGLVAVLGQTLVTASGFVEIYWLMLIGRVFYAIGAEPVLISLYCYCVEWFQLYELNFSFGLLQSMQCLGPLFNLLIWESLYNFVKRVVTSNYILGLCTTPSLIMSVLSVIIVSLLVVKSHNRNPITVSNVRNIKSLITLPLTFWFIVIMISLSFGVIISFVHSSNQILSTKYGLSLSESSEFIGFFNLLGALSAPLPGLLIDVVGRNIIFNLFGIAIGLTAQMLLAFISCNPYIPIVFFSFYFSLLNCCSLPLISYCVESYQISTAYGIFRSCMYLSWIVTRFVSSYLLRSYGIFAVTLYFAACILAAFICGVIAWILDSKTNGILNMSVYRRRILLQLNFV